MQQIFFCPNCGSPISYANRFCGNCGTSLKWEIQQVPPESFFPRYDYQNPGRQQMTNSQQLLYGETARNEVATSPAERPSSGGAATPLSAEVSKLLEDFFDKHAKCAGKNAGT